MRQFVIKTPGLSIGRPGDHRTAEQLRMDDDKLDRFVGAGHAIEVYGELGPPTGRVRVDELVIDDDDDALTAQEIGKRLAAVAEAEANSRLIQNGLVFVDADGQRTVLEGRHGTDGDVTGT